MHCINDVYLLMYPLQTELHSFKSNLKNIYFTISSVFKCVKFLFNHKTIKINFGYTFYVRVHKGIYINIKIQNRIFYAVGIYIAMYRPFVCTKNSALMNIKTSSSSS